LPRNGKFALKSTAVLAALAAALIIPVGTSALAQTPDKPQAQSKPAAKPPVKPKPKAKPAAQPKQTAAPDVPGRKSVCVASVIGREFHVQTVGITIFGNSLERIGIDSWGVDDLAVRKVQDVVGRNYAVRRLPVSAAALPLLEPKPFSGWTQDPMHDFVAAVAGSGPRCAMYLTVTPAGSQIDGTNQVAAGLGILVQGSPVVLIDRTRVFASFIVRAFDGETFKPLRSEKPTTNPLLVNALTGGLSAMNRNVDKTWVPNPPQSAAQSAQLRNATRSLIEEGVAKATRAIFEGP
jgi:hypothetical protein